MEEPMEVEFNQISGRMENSYPLKLEILVNSS